MPAKRFPDPHKTYQVQTCRCLGLRQMLGWWPSGWASSPRFRFVLSGKVVGFVTKIVFCGSAVSPGRLSSFAGTNPQGPCQSAAGRRLDGLLNDRWYGADSGQRLQRLVETDTRHQRQLHKRNVEANG